MPAAVVARSAYHCGWQSPFGEPIAGPCRPSTTAGTSTPARTPTTSQASRIPRRLTWRPVRRLCPQQRAWPLGHSFPPLLRGGACPLSLSRPGEPGAGAGLRARARLLALGGGGATPPVGEICTGAGSRLCRGVAPAAAGTPAQPAGDSAGACGVGRSQHELDPTGGGAIRAALTALGQHPITGGGAMQPALTAQGQPPGCRI